MALLLIWYFLSFVVGFPFPYTNLWNNPLYQLFQFNVPGPDWYSWYSSDIMLIASYVPGPTSGTGNRMENKSHINELLFLKEILRTDIINFRQKGIKWRKQESKFPGHLLKLKEDLKLLWTWERRVVKSSRNWCWHVHTALFKIDNQQGPTE